MASETFQNQKNCKTGSPKSCFLACFGVSHKVNESGKVEQSVYNNKKKKDIALLSWSKVGMNNISKSGSKTVPIDHHHTTQKSAEDHHQQSDNRNNIHTTNAKSSKMKWLNTYRLLKKRDQKIQNHPVSKKMKSFDETPKVAKLFSADQVVQAPKEILEVTSHFGPERKGAVPSRSLNDQVADSGKEDACGQKRSPRTRRSVSGLNQAQLAPPKPNRVITKLAPSVSMPLPSLNADSPSKSLVKTKSTSRQDNNATARRFDPLVGMSVLMVILIIMLVWGRLCAVVCTSAWFYFVARMRNDSKNGDNKSSTDVDLNSEEYKKKVVLEGFLERNHRSSAF